MNDLVLLCLIFFIFVRAIGLGISLDFFYDTKDRKFILFILCWIIWILAALFPIFSDLVESNNLKELFLIINAVLAVLGGLFYLWGLFKYFMNMSFKIMISIIIIFIFTSFFLFFLINYSLSILFSALILNLTLICTYFVPPLKKKDFKKYIGKSIRWYYSTIIMFSIFLPTSIINFLLGESYGLYDSENTLLIMLNYIPIISTTAMLLVLLVHLEYSISTRKKFEIKDKYSHNLGNIMQVIYSASDIIKRIIKPDINEEEKLELIEKKCKEAAKLINEIRNI